VVSRRDLIKMGILGTGGFVLLPPGGGFGRVSSSFSDDYQFSSPRLTPFVDELPTLAELTKVGRFDDIAAYAQPYVGASTVFCEISAAERFVKFHRDLLPTAAWAYVDPHVAPPSEPGRLLTFQMPRTTWDQPRGGGFLVRHINNLPTAPRDFGVPITTTHFHGGHQPAPADGLPSDIKNRRDDFPAHVVMRPGEHFDYMYPFLDVGFAHGQATQDERTSFLWFHDHVLDFTGANVYRGLANFVPIFDEIDTGNENDASPNALRLPSGEFDIPLMLQDKIFDISGALIYNRDEDGFLGDTMVVNGVVQPFHHVKRRKYRFRFLNGANARIFEVFLTNDYGQTFPMTQIGGGGSLLARPIKGVRSFTEFMAERVEIVVDFGDPIFSGEKAVYFENRLVQTDGRKGDEIVSRGTKLVKWILDDDKVTDNSRVPDELRPFATVSAQEIANATRRTFRLDRSHSMFTVNGEPMDIEKVVARPRINTPEIWHVENNSGGWWHPAHTHLELGRVLLKNGRRPPLAERDGIGKNDTALLRGNENVDVFLKFRDYPGPYMSHCHNLEHEDMAMMFRFDVEPW
jgi:FtsP/CotA-like multicopper oxidase with cupredoxin domain